MLTARRRVYGRECDATSPPFGEAALESRSSGSTDEVVNGEKSRMLRKEPDPGLFRFIRPFSQPEVVGAASPGGLAKPTG